jgi:hypothetical protein
MNKGINGIPVKLIVHTDEGSDIETAYFASARKSPEVRKALRELVSAENEGALLTKRATLAGKRLAECEDETALEELGRQRLEAQNRLMDFGDATDGIREKFVLAGFKAAGYDKGTAQRLADSVPPERFGELVAAAQAGWGRVDFVEAATE